MMYDNKQLEEGEKVMWVTKNKVERSKDWSVGPGFESHSEHFMDLFHSSPEL